MEGENYNLKIDSTDVIFLIGFPAANTPANLINKIAENIKSKNKPFFISLASAVDLQKLKIIESELPFSISQITNENV